MIRAASAPPKDPMMVVLIRLVAFNVLEARTVRGTTPLEVIKLDKTALAYNHCRINETAPSKAIVYPIPLTVSPGLIAAHDRQSVLLSLPVYASEGLTKAWKRRESNRSDPGVFQKLSPVNHHVLHVPLLCSLCCVYFRLSCRFQPASCSLPHSLVSEDWIYEHKTPKSVKKCLNLEKK